MNTKKIILVSVLILGFVAMFAAGLWIGAKKLSYSVAQPGTVDFSLFWDSYNTLQEKFIEPSKITNQAILYGAIDGMTRALKDPYTNFFDPTEAKAFQQDLSGTFDGIGVEIGIKKNTLTVIAPLKDTPGQKAGLKSGDYILKINGQDTTDMTTEDAINLIRGPKGTAVTLTVLRSGWTETKDFKIIREKIVLPTAKWELKNDNVAYIQIFQFGETLPSDFEKIALEILKSPAQKIVIDLRDNPGGYLDVAQTISGWFLQRGQVVTIEDFGNGRSDQTYTANGNGTFADFPTVVLINQGSASASEILAGALRDNRNVKLVGIKSFGKGSVQEVISLRGGSVLKITVAHWLTPNKGSISDVGLNPDVKIDITDADVEAGKDPQLDKALEIIKDLK